MVEVSGRVAEENQHVKLGAFHTLDVEVNKDVRIEKDEGGWDSVALGRVEESCVPGRGVEVAAIVCGEGMSSQSLRFRPRRSGLIVMPGTAIFCLLSEHMTVVLQRLEVPIPRKISTQSSAHEKVWFLFALHFPVIDVSLQGIIALLSKSICFIPPTRSIFLPRPSGDRLRFTWMDKRRCLRFHHGRSQSNIE